jgi:WD40 repeat protein/serine/threonine protein kinase
MRPDLAPDEDVLRRLPLPLAQLCRRAHNAWTPLERHLAAFYLWEASLKLLGSAAVVTYAGLGEADPELAECLQSLARPGLGHWWGIVRRLLPVLAERRGGAFVPLRDLLLGKRREDLPRAAGLDAALREHLEGKAGARSGVYLAELLDRLVRYRNKEIGHGAAGARPAHFYESLGRSLLLGAAEVLGRLDVLAGRPLLYVAEVRQAPAGWLAQRYELTGEAARRLEALEVPRGAALPEAGQVYLGGAGLVGLYPLVVYDPEANEAAFLSARRGRASTEYLCYTSGSCHVRPDLGTAQRGLLAQVLGLEVSDEQVSRWAARSEVEEPPGPEAPPGRWTLGEYELLSELGRGGMGVVYRAWQPSLGRQVAVKKLLHGGDARTEARFQREIRALGRVEHPHLVKVFASGAEGDEWFYAMELVEGAPLAAVCERLQGSTASVTEVDLQTWRQAVSTACEAARKAEKPLGGAAPPGPTAAPAGGAAEREPAAGRGYVRQMAELVRQVAGAAHALHERGILHRDIKPGNVMLSPDGTQAVLMDLGLAQVADDEEGRLTRTRQFVGTLRYASPEQLGGARLDRRADVYGLGATLWELLALRPLFGVTEQTPTPDLILKIQQAEPERLRRAHPGLPRDLEAVAHKCLEKAPERRYATAADLADDLGRWLEGKVVRARPVRGWERAAKWVRRRPALAAAYGLLLVALVLGLGGGGALWLWQEADTARRRAEGAEKAARNAHARLAVALAGEQKANREKEAAFKGQAKTERFWKDHFTYLASIIQADRAVQDGEWETARRLLAECPAEHCAWEWDYLRRRCRLDFLTLKGHTGPVTGVAWSPDGTRLASASVDDTVRVWDLGTGRAAVTLKGHKAGVTGVAFSPDGRRLASASFDQTVRLWDLDGGRAVLTLEGHDGFVSGVAFRPDGRQLASASLDGKVRLWDLPSGRETQALRGPTDGVTAVAWSPDGRRLACAGDRTVRVWYVAGGREALTLRGHTGVVWGVAWSPDGKRLASASEDRTIRVWDVESGQAALTLKGHTGGAWGVAWSPDGQRLASASLDRTVRVWDLAGGREDSTLKGHTDLVRGVAWSPDGRRLASASVDQTVRIWNVVVGWQADTLTGHADGVKALAFSADGRQLVSASADKTLRVWDVAGGQGAGAPLRGHGGAVWAVASSWDGRQLASASEDRTVRVWDVPGGREVAILTGHAAGVNGVAFRRDGLLLASGSTDGTVRLWDLPSGREARPPLKGHTKFVSGVAFSPDGTRLASASGDGTVRVWDVATGRGTLTLKGHTAAVWGVAFSPDGLRLASASFDQTVRVWDLRSGREALTLRGHTGVVWGVAWSPDGTRLASASEDRTVRLWDLPSGRTTLTLKGHTGTVTGVAFSPDGRRLASASEDKTVRLWELEPERCWHLREAGSAERGKQCLAAVFHLGRLLEQETRLAGAEAVVLAAGRADPGTGIAVLGLHTQDTRVPLAELLHRRGNAFAEQGEWGPAVADFAAARKMEPASAWHAYFEAWSHLARAYAESRRAGAVAAAADRWSLLAVASQKRLPWDTGSFRRLCAEMRNNFATARDAYTVDLVVWTRTVIPDGMSAAEAEEVLGQAKRAVDAAPTNLSLRMRYGAALYRTGRYKEAVHQLNNANLNESWTRLFLAMAHYQLGERQRARAWLDAVNGWRPLLLRPLLGEPKQAPDAPDSSLGPWTGRLYWLLLREEAEDLLASGPP